MLNLIIFLIFFKGAGEYLKIKQWKKTKTHLIKSASFQDVGIIQAIDFWANLCIPFTLFVIAFILNGYYLSILIPEFRKMNDTWVTDSPWLVVHVTLWRSFSLGNICK